MGGGIDAENACEFLTAGASHVIVTSYVFRDGHVFYENLDKLVTTVGKQRLTLDLSCRKWDGKYYIFLLYTAERRWSPDTLLSGLFLYLWMGDEGL